MANRKPYMYCLFRILRRCTVDPITGCHNWPGACSGYGYPVANVCGRGSYAYLHKEVFRLLVGDIPKDFVVDHKCNNKKCLNPDHLQTLSDMDNVHKETSGIHAPGRIRTFDYDRAFHLRSLGWTQRRIAEELGTNRSSVEMALLHHKPTKEPQDESH